MKKIYNTILDFILHIQKAREAAALARMGDYIAAKKLYE